jgi:signal transduction histidine kinase
MELSAFIRENIEAILNEWEEFAASIPSAKEMNRRELRDDAQACSSLSRTATADTVGLGLGLCIACSIAQAHRGTLRVESTRHDGTTFAACLPR